VTRDAEDSGEEPEGPPIWQAREQGPAEGRRARRLARRVSLVAIALLAVLVGGTAGTLYYVSDQLGDQVHRVPKVLAHLDPAGRPPEGHGTTFLLMGIDTRSPERTTDRARSDPTPLRAGPRAQRRDHAAPRRPGGQARHRDIPSPRLLGAEAHHRRR
jgi:hypothetical protein